MPYASGKTIGERQSFIGRFVRRAVGAVRNWYEGGFPLMGGDRSWLPAIVQDARFDQNFVTRRELMRKARYFSQNNPVVKRILDVQRQYVIGPRGLHLTPASSDVAWNKRAHEVWHEMSRDCGVDGESLAELMHAGHDCERVDGEAFFIKTRIKGPRGSVPKLQHVEAHRVETPPGLMSEEGTSVIDGVAVKRVLTPDGRQVLVKTGYWVRDGSGMWETSYTYVPRELMVHVGEAQRGGQMRFISSFYSTMNTIHDLDDLQILEMKAAKDAAEKSTVIKNATGELDPALMRKMRFGGVTEPATSGDDALKKREEYAQSKVGGRTLALKSNEDIAQFINNRPTIASQQYWDYLTTLVCVGQGVAKCLVFPAEKGQGTLARVDVDVANSVFRARSMKWQQMESSVFEYFFGWAIYNDLRVVDPPADWRRVSVHPPRAVNVDIGKNSAAMLAELQAGATNFDLIYGPLGLDWRTMFDHLKEQRDYAAKLGLPIFGTPQANGQTTANGADAKEGTEPAAQPLNGAQITAALDVMVRVREGSLSTEAAAELLAQIGIERSKAQDMVQNVPAMDSGAGDVAFKREVLQSLLSVPAAREAVYNSLSIEALVTQTGLPAEPGYKAPWIPVVAAPGQAVNGDVVKDPQGDIVGGAMAAIANPQLPTAEPKEPKTEPAQPKEPVNA